MKSLKFVLFDYSNFYNLKLFKFVFIQQVTDIYTQGKKKFKINCLRINGSLLLDHSKLAVVDNGNYLNIYQFNSDNTLSLKEQYTLQFNEYELISVSMSHKKDLIVLGGQMNVVVSLILFIRDIIHYWHKSVLYIYK